MSCKPVCKLCPNLVISQAVTFTGGNLEINLPAGSYNDCEKYCIVVAQAIPDTATINAPVYITIGTGTTLYPLTKRNCAQVTACGIRTRTRRKLNEGSSEIIDALRQGHVSYVINTIDINQHNTRLDGYEIRRTAVENNVTVFTALETVKVLLDVLEEITLRVSTIDSK